MKIRFSSSLASSLLLLALGSTACSRNVNGDRPDGWEDESHSNDVPGNYAQVFSTDKVHRIDVSIDSAVFAEMTENLEHSLESRETPLWFESTIHQGDIQWTKVGIRYRSLSSIEKATEAGSKKFPFRLSFDRLELENPEIKNQRFYGFKKMYFANNDGDDSYLHEVMASEIFRDQGVPAPQSALYRIYVNTGSGSVYWGLYTMLEDPDDKAMLRENFGEAEGNLYKPNGPGADWTRYLESAFVKKNNHEAADYADVEAAVNAVVDYETEGAEWRTAVESKVDVQGFLRWLAVNTSIVNGDAYGCEPHNYYLYGVGAKQGRLAWIPWAQEDAFEGSVISCGSTAEDAFKDQVTDIYHQDGANFPLIYRLILDQSSYRDDYTGYLDSTLKGAFDIGTFSARANELHDMIAKYVTGSEGESPDYTSMSSAEAFDNSVTGEGGLIPHAQERYDLVQAAVATGGM